MKKKISLSKIFAIVIALVAVFAIIFLLPKPQKKGAIVRKTYALSIDQKEDHSSLDLDVLKGSSALFGREQWQKGEIVNMELKSINVSPDRLEVGIIPAENMDEGWGYNDYGLPITERFTKECHLVNFVVPEDGEYGILVRETTEPRPSLIPAADEVEILNRFNSIDAELVINQNFKNPLVQ